MKKQSNWQKHIAAQALKGRKRRNFFATDREYNAMEKLLIKMRDAEEVKK